VENQRGGGSLFEFSLDLPVGVASQQLIPLNLGRSILVIEPHARTRASLVHILQSAGYRTLEAHAIPERIPLAQLALVIVDSSLVTEALLQSCRSAPLPVATLILTPLALRHSLPIRGDAVTSKPIQRELFLHAVARLVGDVSGEFFRSEPPAPRPEHILVVEDNLINQKVLSAMLRKMGYRFELAADGRQAIEQIHRQHFDIILMDCFMPVMDGYEATRQIRATESHHHTIIAVTANVLEGDREKCLAAGMDDYLAKPVDSATLALVLERHCLLLAARRAL
ncbi:MAG: response regulator, partial [Polyangiaceae bacterium]|nr:response regulator [Polyangiaceae bacterium]